MKPRTHVATAGALLALTLSSSLATASSPSTPWEGETKDILGSERQATPEDRYAMAGGCYAVRADSGAYVARAGDGYAATAATRGDAEPFHFQATDLGSYLLFDTSSEFVSASEGVVGEAASAATGSLPGQIAGGVVLEQTDRAAETASRSAVNEAAGRGAAIVSAPMPSELADWIVEEASTGTFSMTLPSLDRGLGVRDDGALVLRAEAAGDPFAFELLDASRCATYPDVEINVEGDPLGGLASHQEVRGFFEAHLHMMAFEFIGGRVRCGRPWHRYGVAYALVDCPDHEPGGAGAILEQVLSGFGPHNTDGWPTFAGWPRPESLTHEQVYVKWLERAWRGGLRLAVNLLVDNRQLCQIYPFKRNSCNEMDGVRLQARRIRELERYIDAQSGGPGEGWFRIVSDPFEARRVINEGRLAVILGIEVSVPLDCGRVRDVPLCSESDIDARLDEVYDLGVRQMELVNKFDNALSGVTGDAGTTGIVVNQGNFGETGSFWRMETCEDPHSAAHDKGQINLQDEGPLPSSVFGRDALAGGIFQTFGKSGVVPAYPEGPHCNVLGLSELGESMIRGMADRGMIFDPDHMSAKARTEATDLIEELGYSGIVSSHGWADSTIYPRIYELGGVVAPHAGGSTGFISKWLQHKSWRDDRFYFGLGFGSDMNGFSAQGRPRGANAPNAVQYPFTGFGGVTVDKQVSGTKTYDINVHGVAHYGLYPDWMEDLRRQAGSAVIEDLARGAEAYLQMWERAIGIAPNACRDDVEDLSDDDIAAISPGTTARAVMDIAGQPQTRTAGAYTYCMTGGRTATVAFDGNESVVEVTIA